MMQKQYGVLVIHGFTAFPGSVAPLVDALAARDVHVAAPVLKGHGESSPEHLRGVTWQDWMLDAETAFTELSRQVDHILVVGHSMGALIALNLAARFQDAQLDALVLAAPPFRVTSMLGPGRPLHAFAPLLKRLFRSWELDTEFGDREEVCRSVHYHWAPTDAIFSFFKLIAYTEDRLKNVRAPFLLLLGGRDRTIRAESAEVLDKGVATRAEEKEVLLLELSDHQMFCDSEKERAIDAVTAYLCSRFPCSEQL